MYTAENYFWGLVGYGLGALLILLALWVIARSWRWWWLRHGLLLVTAVLLLTPMQPYSDSSFLAPALFVSVFEGMSRMPETGFGRGLLPIGVVLVAALALYACIALVVSRIAARR